jgi:hypothetical protein
MIRNETSRRDSRGASVDRMAAVMRQKRKAELGVGTNLILGGT